MANENSSHDDLKLEFETRALHVGQEATQWSSRAVVPPIVMSTTFQQYSPAMTAVSLKKSFWLSAKLHF